MFASKTALWFSPDAKKLAYIRFDDTNVQRMNLPIYGNAGSLDFQYPQSIALHYPKVGTVNPIVNLYTVDLTSLEIGKPVVQHEQAVPEQLKNEDHIIGSVVWQNNASVISLWTNRVQNQAYMQSCTDSVCKVVII